MQELLASTITSELKVPHVIARLLVKRGCTSVAEAYYMLFGEKNGIQDPFLMLDMNEAVDWVLAVRDRQEKIFIFGDYDLDGLSSVALLTRGLKEIGIATEWRLPNRFSSGYGLSVSAIDEMIEAGAKNIITVDTGITAVTEIEYAKSKGLQVMVVDHHQPSGDGLPACDVLLDPHREEDSYKNEELCGVGLSYKLICALFSRLGLSSAEKFLDLVALGTLADLVPLTEENKMLTRSGLKKMCHSDWYGVQELCRDVLNMHSFIGGQDVLFRIAPILNAPGRMGCADAALHLLLCDDPMRAPSLLASLKEWNVLRKKKEAEISEAAIRWVHSRYGNDIPSVLIIDGNDWHLGVIGIVAAKVAQEFSRPTAILSLQPDGTAHASARSVLGFNWHKALFEFRHLFDRWGGHANAAGFSIPVSEIESFREQLILFAANQNFFPDECEQKTSFDILVALSELDEAVMDWILKMEPYGGSFPYPVFKAEKVKIHKLRELRGNHLQMEINQNGSRRFSAIAFGMGNQKSKIEQNNFEATVVFEPTWNVYNRKRSIQLAIKAMEFER
ncbi:MAG: single-stranded-DNA-specific exonuclease RecJ [Fibrobacter sp.]|nr:single-stranded-DNA-specific exonuclease RecJ [Fibrobacter sp.]